MTLKEISEGYRSAAVLVRFQINEVKEQMSAGHGDEAVLRERTKNLRYILRELNELRYLTEHYYTSPRDPKYTCAAFYARRGPN